MTGFYKYPVCWVDDDRVYVVISEGLEVFKGVRSEAQRVKNLMREQNSKSVWVLLADKPLSGRQDRYRPPATPLKLSIGMSPVKKLEMLAKLEAEGILVYEELE